MPGRKLTTVVKAAYGVGEISSTTVGNIRGFFLNKFLLDVAQVDPYYSGLILLVGKMWDAVNDPIVGTLSDRTQSRWGRRRPWILFCALPFGLFYALLWTVPDFLDTPIAKFGYYLIISLFLDSFYTAVSLPYTALTPEMAHTYDEVTNLTKYRMGFGLVGGLVASFVHATLIISFVEDGRINYATGYLVSGLLFGAVIVLCNFITFAFTFETSGMDSGKNDEDEDADAETTPLTDTGLSSNGGTQGTGYGSVNEHASSSSMGTQSSKYSSLTSIVDEHDLYHALEELPEHQKRIPGLNMRLVETESGTTEWEDEDEAAEAAAVAEGMKQASKQPGMVEGFRAAFSNRPFVYVMLSYLFSWIAVNFTQNNLILYTEYVLGLREYFSGLLLAVQLSAAVFIPVWEKLSHRIGKKAVFNIGMAILFSVQICLLFVPAGQLVLMYFMAVFAGIGISVAFLIPWSMLPDVIDLDELETGVRREGVFYSFFVFFQKLGLAVGLGVSNVLLGAGGYVTGAPKQDSEVLFLLRLLVGPIPALLLFLSQLVILKYPLTRKVHKRIQARLRMRKEAAMVE